MPRGARRQGGTSSTSPSPSGRQRLVRGRAVRGRAAAGRQLRLRSGAGDVGVGVGGGSGRGRGRVWGADDSLCLDIVRPGAALLVGFYTFLSVVVRQPAARVARWRVAFPLRMEEKMPRLSGMPARDSVSRPPGFRLVSTPWLSDLTAFYTFPSTFSPTIKSTSREVFYHSGCRHAHPCGCRRVGC